jgi:glycosyltransferase involved in cell wall biosynthesis
MIEKVDLVMWTKNGEKFLPKVFKRIDEVIPHKVINKKILVDDHSTDRTIEIAKNFKWDVYKNPSTGISSGANEALRHVETEFFISFEQDILLAKDWWTKIPKHMEDRKVVVAQGIRLPTHPSLRKFAEYSYCDAAIAPGGLSRRRKKDKNAVSESLDNTIYRSDVIRKLGGFPTKCPIFTSSDLFEVVESNGFKWIVDHTVVSDHIRCGLMEEIRHEYSYMIRRRRD